MDCVNHLTEGPPLEGELYHAKEMGGIIFPLMRNCAFPSQNSCPPGTVSMSSHEVWLGLPTFLSLNQAQLLSFFVSVSFFWKLARTKVFFFFPFSALFSSCRPLLRPLLWLPTCLPCEVFFFFLNCDKIVFKLPFDSIHKLFHWWDLITPKENLVSCIIWQKWRYTHFQITMICFFFHSWKPLPLLAETSFALFLFIFKDYVYRFGYVRCSQCLQRPEEGDGFPGFQAVVSPLMEALGTKLWSFGSSECS